MRIAGIGLRASATAADLDAALALAGPVEALATASIRAAALEALARGRWRVLAVDVANVATHTQSWRIKGRFGTGSVAEAAALKAAGPGARLVLVRQVVPEGRATVAVAEGEG